MKEDILFLKELQKELNSQETDCQASPRFWVVGDYKWVTAPDGSAERYRIYLPSRENSYELRMYFDELRDDQDNLSEEALDSFEEIDDESVFWSNDVLEWVQSYIDEDAELFPEEKVHYIVPNTLFLTKKEAKTHIDKNKHHYTEDVHTYAMTAWRSPVVEKLLRTLETLDWNIVLNKLEDDKK